MESAVAAILLFLCCVSGGVQAQCDCNCSTWIHDERFTDIDADNTTAVLDAVLVHMDSRVRPNAKNGAVVVRCSIQITGFGSISEQDMDHVLQDYTMDIYLRQTWHDPRLTFPQSIANLTISAPLIHAMWKPDLFFPTEKHAAFHEVTTPNVLMRLYHDGTVIYTMRLTLILACPMDLTNFPMDHQECGFTIESYANDVNELVLEWQEDGPVLIDDVELPQFDLLNISTFPCPSMTYKTGTYACLKGKFSLKRQYGFYLLQTYIPSILIVIISWVSFWINMDAVPARISLGVTTVLTMATQLSGSKTSIPRISYPKAIDIWMFVCMTFVFGALIQYAFVNTISQAEKKRFAKYMKDGGDASAVRSEKDIFWLSASRLDSCSRIGFPLLFLIFNIVYWPYFALPRHKP